jgi:hypothetical protein
MSDVKDEPRVTAPPVIEGRVSLRHGSESTVGNDWNVIVPASTPIEALFDPHYWTHNAKKFRIGDILHVQCDDRSFYVQLYVRHAERLYAHVEALVEKRFGEQVKPLDSDYHEVKWTGFGKWAVIDTKAKKTVKDGFADRQAAEGFLHSYLRQAA